MQRAKLQRTNLQLNDLQYTKLNQLFFKLSVL